jgi:uncharacterized protein
MLDRLATYAIIGASNDKQKYGHIILSDLKAASYKVIPINLKEEEILGLKVYPTLTKAITSREKIDVVVFVIPPPIVIRVLLEVRQLGLKKVWMQPGSESEEAIKFCQDNGIEVIHHACVMVERKKV